MQKDCRVLTNSTTLHILIQSSKGRGSMAEIISPINITSAAFLTQIMIIVIMSICAIILLWGEKFAPTGPYYGPKASVFILVILILTLTTSTALIFSDAFWEMWKPLFGGTIPPVLPWSSSIQIMFLLDIFCVTILVMSTGGSQRRSSVLSFFLCQPSQYS